MQSPVKLLFLCISLMIAGSPVSLIPKKAKQVAKSGHMHLVEKMPVAGVTTIINNLMMHEPKKNAQKQ